MKITGKLWALSLAVLFIITGLPSGVFAETESTLVQSKNYISVSGTAGAYADVSVILKKSGAALSENTVLYIGETKADETGVYALDFIVSDKSFTVEQGVVKDYEIVINANGITSTETIDARANISEVVTFDIDMSVKGKAKAVFQSDVKYKNLDYLTLVAFYSSEKRLLKVVNAKGYIGENGVFNYSTTDIPEGTDTVTGFIWESRETMIPVTAAQKAVYNDKHYDRKAEYVTMAPGGNESERNLAWYDIAGVTGVRVQYAEKISGTETDFGEDNIFSGTYGSI